MFEFINDSINVRMRFVIIYVFAVQVVVHGLLFLLPKLGLVVPNWYDLDSLVRFDNALKPM